MATMAPRIQNTPYGTVKLTSRWNGNRKCFYLLACGPLAALAWMFQGSARTIEKRNHGSGRHIFAPGDKPVRDLQRLNRVCSEWQSMWNEELDGERAADDPVCLRQLVERFKKFQDGQVALTTMHKYDDHMKRWFRVLGAEVILSEITAEKIVEARKQLLLELSPVTVNNTMATLKRILRFAFDQGWASGTLNWKQIRSLREPDREATWWEPHEVSIALRAAEQDQLQPTAVLLIYLGTQLGLRLGEMVNLRWQDLQLDRKDPRSGSPAPLCNIRNGTDWSPKSGIARTIPIPSSCHKELKKHRKPSGHVLESERAVAKKGGTRRVYRWDPRKLWFRIRDAAVAQGATPIRLHDLRHTDASILLNQGFSAEKVARWLGHSSTRLVHKVYGHLLAFDDQINAARFEDHGNNGRIVKFPAY